jgi:phospholipase/carboxylesterase
MLDTLGLIARRMHPRRLRDLVALLDGPEAGLAKISWSEPPIRQAALHVLQASSDLRAALVADNPMREAYRALRHYSRALEALAGLAEANPAIGHYLLEPRFRNDPVALARLAAPLKPDTGVFHSANETAQHGGYSVYVPPWIDPALPAPMVMALHGGSGHGRLFLWNWLPEARARGLIVVAPTATGSTWSLMEPEIDIDHLHTILTQVRARWAIDPDHMLLTGMSDGGTFTLIGGMSDGSPFTHLAPVAASFHPMLLAMSSPRRLTGLPVHLTHGAMDWMFPVDMARTSYRTLKAAGAAITYREIADLSHAYPRDEQGEVLDWLLA